jgi:hypothetical protein
VSTDTYLRQHGFAIVSRPKGGPAVWRDTRSNPHQEQQTTYTHDEAVVLADMRQSELPVAVEA